MAQPRTDTRQDGPAIRRTRQKRGIKAGRLAGMVEAAPSTIYGLENGHRNASIELLHRIATALDVQVTEILATPADTAVAQANAEMVTD